MDLQPIQSILQDSVPAVTPALQLVVRWRGQVVTAQTAGFTDPETNEKPVDLDTRFDLASVTKLFVVTTFMTLVEAGQVSLDDPVGQVLPEFSGRRPIQPYEDPLSPGQWVTVAEPGEVDLSAVTFRHLLSHTSGLPAWRPLYKEPDAASARRLALITHFSYPTGQRIVYSDIGLILLGLSIERLTGQALDEAVAQRVIQPLGLAHTGYIRLPAVTPLENIAPTEYCAWRGRRVVGEVHDENAHRLGGVSGHAGLFSTAGDVARFGQAFLHGGAPLLQPVTVHTMTQLQAEFGDLRRGLGFVLWSPDPEASSNPFSPSTFGHTGFTGTCLWIDPLRQLVVALLTNDVYHGRTGRGIMPLRIRLHQAIVAAVDSVPLDTLP